MTQVPGLLELLADERIGALFASAKPALVLDREGGLLFANRATLNLLRADTHAEVAAAVAAERGPFASALRQLSETAEGAAQIHTLPLKAAGTRRAFQLTGTRIALNAREPVFLLTSQEPANGAPSQTAAAGAVFDGVDAPYALFAPDGKKIHANAAAANLVGGAMNLTDLIPGSHHALAKARSEGEAELSFGVLRMSLRRIGNDDYAIAAAFTAPVRAEAEQATPKQVVRQSEPEPTKIEPSVQAAQPAKEQAPVDRSPEPVKEEPVAVIEETTEPVAAAPEPKIETPKAASKPPSRFVWQTDADNRFSAVSAELAIIVGSASAAIAGMDWREAGAIIGIDGTDAVAKAVARRDTWSGITVTWPVDGDEFVRPVELAALPVFDRERRFLGYRGFGVFREQLPRPIEATKKTPPRLEELSPIVTDKHDTPADFELPAEPPVFGKRSPNVVPLHKGASEPARPSLSPTERNAFREIAKAIGTRMSRTDASNFARTPARPESASRSHDGERAVLDRLPIGVVVHRNDHVLYANRTLLDWTGLESTEALESQGGIARLFANGHGIDSSHDEAHGPIAIRGHGDEPIPVEARLVSAPWEGETALVYVLRRAGSGIDERMEAGELALRDAEAAAREMRSILDTATDGVALLDREGRVLGMNRSAEALFGFDSAEIEGRNFTTLFAPESHRAAMDYLDGLATNGVASVLNDGREVIGRVREGGLIPLFMTLGRVGDAGSKFCAVFRDITQWKRAEEELIHARRQAERANSAKSDFLAKISHEIRTPLSSIIGFAEVMMEERLGPIGNERYRGYLKDIHTSGDHLVSLINDLLDLSKIEAGKLDLTFASVDLNEVASQSMALMQPQANRERIIIRTALSPNLPPVVADARSIRQIVLNLLSNSIRFTPPGGQVIVSTTLTDEGEVHLRVRDTGIGMTDAEIKTALEPFRQIATSGRGKETGTGLGLPLTKALVEANRASFSIKSTVNAGTLVEIAFPSTRVLAE
ncbi:MAG TPA: ATP-binding protein [Xanthobacteraceae bacterium]|nr:ATP-binding protein [Xanthobacteraceae bacterium]